LKKPSPKTVPQRKALRQMKYYVKNSTMPSTDALQNIIAKHANTFLLKIELFPICNIVLASPVGLQMLITHGKSACLDGTFNICEDGLILTTILVRYQNLGFPLVWILSNSKTGDNYEHLLRFIIKKTGGRWDLQQMFVDFEEALRVGIRGAFGGQTSILNDSFHFIQANLKWMKGHGGKEHTKDLIRMLRFVWSAPSLQEFDARSKEFVVFWANRHAEYTKYFVDTWLKQFRPPAWAYFGRINSGASTGSCMCNTKNILLIIVYR
jgi:hypothetical protein